MTLHTRPDQARPLTFPFETPPAYGEVLEVAAGLRWLRVPLPYRLDHVNIYLLEDDGGWAIFDTGIRTAVAQAVWDRLFAGPLAGIRITRIIVSHYHPDHIGLAGWLCARFDVPLLTSYSTYAASKMLSLDPHSTASEQNQSFYRRYGMTAEAASIVATHGLDYLREVTPLPKTFYRLLMGDTLTIGSRRFRVLSADGHAPEQVLLCCAEEALLLAADQVLEKITPNISVWAMEPTGDPLGHYMRTLRGMTSEIPDDVLVLPGHRRPFHGLHRRCAEILAHHEERCSRAIEACREGPKSVDELVPALFHSRNLTAHEMSFAFTETLAHVNRLIRRGDLAWSVDAGRPVCRLP